MIVIAKLKHLRIAPRKVRLVADLIRGRGAEEAQTILNFVIKKSSLPLTKLLKTAIANAKNNFQLESANLFISKITVDEGPKYKRWRPRARGQAYEIQKKTSHITIVLDEIKKTVKKTKKIKGEVAQKEKIEKEEAIIKPEKPKFKPKIEEQKPATEKGLRKIFRRKSF